MPERDDLANGGITFSSTADISIQISTDHQWRDSITLVAPSTNTGTVYFGSVLSQQVPLPAGSSATVHCSRLDAVWVKDSTVGDFVAWFCGGSPLNLIPKQITQLK